MVGSHAIRYQCKGTALQYTRVHMAWQFCAAEQHNTVGKQNYFMEKVTYFTTFNPCGQIDIKIVTD